MLRQSRLQLQNMIILHLMNTLDSSKLNEFSVKQDLENSFAACNLKRFSMTKAILTALQIKTFFQKLNNRKSKWTPLDGQFATVDFFLQKCLHDVSKLKFNRNSRSFNLKPDEWYALLNLRKSKDITIKAADKGGSVVVWRTDLYRQFLLLHS